MARRRRRDSAPFEYWDAATIGRTVSEDFLARMELIPECTAGATRFRYRAEYGSDYDTRISGLGKLLTRHYDVVLYFENGGQRDVTIRVPTRSLSLETVRPYLAPDGRYGLNGLFADIDGDDLLLRFTVYGEDSELFNLGETGGRWLDLILPVREELIGGDLTALGLGRLIEECDFVRDEGEPDLPASYGLTKATRILAAYFLTERKTLVAWQQARGSDDSTSYGDTPDSPTTETPGTSAKDDTPPPRIDPATLTRDQADQLLVTYRRMLQWFREEATARFGLDLRGGRRVPADDPWVAWAPSSPAEWSLRRAHDALVREEAHLAQRRDDLP